MSIIDYKIIFESGFSTGGYKRLTASVKEAIEEGWQPIGGVATQGSTISQAMVKYKVT